MNFFQSIDNFCAENLPGWDSPKEARERQARNNVQENTQKINKFLEEFRDAYKNESPENKLKREKLERLPEYKKYAVVALVVTVVSSVIGMMIGSALLAVAGLILIGVAATSVSDFNKISEKLSCPSEMKPIQGATDANDQKRRFLIVALKTHKEDFLSFLFEGTLIVPLFAR